MSLRTLLAGFPKDSQFRRIVRDLASADLTVRDVACQKIQQLSRFDSWEAARTPDWSISETDAQTILAALQELEFPHPERDWKDGVERLISLLWRSPYPGLVAPCASVYGRLTTGKRRSAVLSLLGVIATRPAAEAFMACIRNHGWPDQTYSRLFEELEKLFRFADVLLPDILLSAGAQSEYVSDAMLAAACRKWLDFSTLGNRLEPLVPVVVKDLKQSLRAAAKFQRPNGIAWRSAERYWTLRNSTSSLLDFAGWLDTPELIPMLRHATTMTDPRIVSSAAISLVRRGVKVGSGVFHRIAASHEMRHSLFCELSALGQERLYPGKWRTWEAFGASQMVEWLMYPAEMGREPDEIHLGHTEWVGPRRQKTVFHVWKFRNRGEKWYAGVSGPHRLAGQPKPLADGTRFSRFDDWGSATPREHVQRFANTMDEFSNS